VGAIDKFFNLHRINELARIIVQSNKHRTHPQSFSITKVDTDFTYGYNFCGESIFRNKIYQRYLRNKMCNQLMNDCLITHVEKEIFEGVSDSAILCRF
jgi:hypothetical protein